MVNKMQAEMPCFNKNNSLCYSVAQSHESMKKKMHAVKPR